MAPRPHAIVYSPTSGHRTTRPLDVVIVSNAHYARGGLSGWWCQFVTGDGQLYTATGDTPWTALAWALYYWHERNVLGVHNGMARPVALPVIEGPRTRQGGHREQLPSTEADRSASAAPQPDPPRSAAARKRRTARARAGGAGS